MTDLSYLVELEKEHQFPTCALLSNERRVHVGNVHVEACKQTHLCGQGFTELQGVLGAASVGTEEILSSNSRWSNN